MNKTDYIDDRFYYMDQLSSVTENSNSSTNRDISIGYEGFNLGYGDAANSVQQLSKKFHLTVIASERLHLRLFSGAEQIIQAWRDCMANRGGPTARFEIQGDLSSNHVLLKLEYFRHSLGGDVQPTLVLASPVTVPAGMKVTGGEPRCLKVGYEFVPGSRCTVQLDATSQWTTMSAVFPFNVKGGRIGIPVDTYLPPRAEIKWRFLQWPTKDQRQDFVVPAYTTGRTLYWSVPAATDYFILANYVPRKEISGNLPGCGGSINLNPAATVADVMVTTGTVGQSGTWHCSLHMSGGVQSQSYWDPEPPANLDILGIRPE